MEQIDGNRWGLITDERVNNETRCGAQTQAHHGMTGSDDEV